MVGFYWYILVQTKSTYWLLSMIYLEKVIHNVFYILNQRSTRSTFNIASAESKMPISETKIIIFFSDF